MAIKPVFEAVADAQKRIENVSIEELREAIQGDEDMLLVDLREIQERVDLGTIPRAKHAPRGMLEFWADPASPYYRDWFRESRRTVLFCAAGGRSALAARALEEMGFTNVAHLEAGFDGWRDAGEEVQDVSATSRWVRRET